MKQAVISGAASFTGTALAEQLLERGIGVHALVRPGSAHNGRLPKGMAVIEATPEEYGGLRVPVFHEDATFFHLLWGGEKGVRNQMPNIGHALASLELAHRMGCRRWVAAGSQAEYGIVPPDTEQTEDLACRPVMSYGAAKTAACHLSGIRAKELGVEWVWARIFSLTGRHEPRGRMLPDLYRSLKEGKDFHMSSGRQNWDFLDVHDAADALIALAERGHDGETYNVAHGGYRPLKEYTEELRAAFFPRGKISYGDDPVPFISLQPSVEKIREHTGWKAEREFLDSVRGYEWV